MQIPWQESDLLDRQFFSFFSDTYVWILISNFGTTIQTYVLCIKERNLYYKI